MNTIALPHSIKIAGMTICRRAVRVARRAGRRPSRTRSSQSYDAFLRSKVTLAVDAGFDVDPADMNPLLLPHQRDIVIWACKGGRRAIFAAFGLGKSIMQIEILRLVLLYLGHGRALLIAPLGVRQEFARDASLDTPQFAARAADLGLDHADIMERFGVTFRFVRRSSEVDADGFYICNYEAVRDGNLSPDLFNVVSLDEASCLRSSNSKTYHTFLSLFNNVPCRFVATATPSPNDYVEILNYAGFLAIMDKSQARTRFFERNPKQANDLTLRENMRQEWWAWVHSWAVFLLSPADLGYDATGYDLPPYEVVWHEVASGQDEVRSERNGQGKLFGDASASLSEGAAEKRGSMDLRIAKMREIMAESPDDHFVLWHDLEAERYAIQSAVPDATSVWGTQDLDEREQRIVDFSQGRVKYLSTKPVIAGSGPNFQYHCHREIFTGIGYKFNDFIQAIHRVVRFQQSQPCRIDIIYTEAERPIREKLLEKWAKHDETQTEMQALIREFGLSKGSLRDTLNRRVFTDRRESRGNLWHYINCDTIPETRRMANAGDQVDMILSSIPFGTQYAYTTNYNDLGHNDDNPAFWRQMDFLTPNLLKVLKPGRIAAIHVKDRVSFGAFTGLGFPTIEPFHADAIFHFRKHGFAFMGMITVDTDVVKENNSTYRLGWSECCKDGTKMGVGVPEYVLIFRKPPTDLSDGYADDPVAKAKKRYEVIDGIKVWENLDGYSRARWQLDAHAHWKSSGARLLTPEEIEDLDPTAIPRAWAIHDQETPYNYWEHVRLAEELEQRSKLSSNFMMIPPISTLAQSDAIWSDVVRQLTLNGSQTAKGLNNHICPLQWDIVDRLIHRYSNPGDLIFDPFAGIGTVPYRAIKWGRKGRGHELNASYFNDGVRYCHDAESAASMPTLFDLLDEEPSEEVLELMAA